MSGNRQQRSRIRGAGNLPWTLTIAIPMILAFGFGPAQAFSAPKRDAGKKTVKVPPSRRVTIKPVDPSAAPDVIKSAKVIDAMVADNQKKHHIEPNPKTTEEEFVRRIYLDIAGTIPTYRQISVYLASSAGDKRARLIDTLLNSPGYASHHFNYWADILRLTDRFDGNVTATAYNESVKQSLEENRPYDRWVHELLATEGKYLEKPATGYLIRDLGMPLDAMSNTLRIFLGTQIGCAQCHNHPFDVWTQKEFYEMAAFTFGTQARVSPRDKNLFGGQDRIRELKEELKKLDPKFKGGGQYNRILTGNLYVVSDVPNRVLKLPHTYAYSDAKPDAVVKPATLLGPEATIKPNEPPRLAFARWLTAPENPRFALTIANRLWKLAMGRGQIEPVDDIRDDSVAENPELLNFLVAEMIRLKFDMKEFLRIIYNTEAYQRQANFDELQPDEVYHFPGPVLKRMTAEQVWDSFITLAVFHPDEYRQPPSKLERNVLNLDLKSVKGTDVMARFREFNELNSAKVKAAREKDHRYKGQLLVRASELPLPTPPGHFLREFGQSDHELIQASSTEGSVPQVLQMFNGPITHMLLEEGSLMYHNVMAKGTPEERVRIIFLSILGRKPSKDEQKIALEEIRAHNQAGYGNVIWSLVNTREFLFIQ